MGIDTLVLYSKKRLLDTAPQWRWRYVAAGNHEKLANGGESYQQLEDCVLAAARVTGFNPQTLDWDLIETHPNGTEVFHVQRAGGGLLRIRREM